MCTLYQVTVLSTFYVQMHLTPNNPNKLGTIPIFLLILHVGTMRLRVVKEVAQVRRAINL